VKCKTSAATTIVQLCNKIVAGILIHKIITPLIHAFHTLLLLIFGLKWSCYFNDLIYAY